MTRATPYSGYNFVVTLDGATTALGGFSEVTGLNIDVGKPLGVRKSTDVTLKRGVMNAGQLSAWLEANRSATPRARREVTITLQDEKGRPLKHWTLRQARPAKYTGPDLNAKGTDVAMEELVLSSEGIVSD